MLDKRLNVLGYIYRVSDFSDNQFVIARDMIISSDNQTVVVGFLCNSKEVKNLPDKTWIEITGKITYGDYHGGIPLIDVLDLKRIEKPADCYVSPPDENYVPTAVLF